MSDCYPDKFRMQSLFLSQEFSPSSRSAVASFYQPYRYRNRNRCDLHPRWSPDGREIAVDSCHDGKRGLYTLGVDVDFYRKSNTLNV